MMLPAAIRHQFEFWSHIGQVGGYFHQYDGFSSLSPKDATWPSKIFNLNENYIPQLKSNIERHHLSKSVAIEEIETLEAKLQEHGFKRTSTVEAMTMKIKGKTHYATYPEIEKVTDTFGVNAFAKIASEAFGYIIYPNTITPLIQSERIQLFMGKHQNSYVSCGIVFRDSDEDSGLHMIGAKKQFRGLGLGKKMTEHLLHFAIKNNSEHIHLVASKLGAPIYYKLGFQNRGYLKSYTF